MRPAFEPGIGAKGASGEVQRRPPRLPVLARAVGSATGQRSPVGVPRAAAKPSLSTNICLSDKLICT